MADSSKVDNLLEKVIKYTVNPEYFLSRNDDNALGFSKITKKLYDFSQIFKLDAEKNNGEEDNVSLPNLIIKGFDDEQIWQQMELKNSEVIGKIIDNLANLGCKKKMENVGSNREIIDENENEVEGEEFEDGGDDFSDNDEEFGDEDDAGSFHDDNTESEGSEEDEFESESESLRTRKEKNNENKVQTKSVVDDKFFKLSQMEQFLNAEDENYSKEKRGDEKSDDEIDYFAEISSNDDDDDEEENEENEDQKLDNKRSRYNDFFDSVSEDENEEEENGNDEESQMSIEEDVRDSDVDNSEKFEKPKKELKSTMEIRQERLKRKIEALEENNLADKPWQLKGEATSSSRPENSLLQEHALFEHNQRLAPTITEETTHKLEDIIRQRIKSQTWDDVERKLKPKEEPFEYKKRLTLDQEKSKLTLAEIYEQEYLKQQQHEKTEKELPEHTEIKTMMKSLFSKLDALSNFHFTPKVVAPEVKIVSNLPSVVVEEVAPVTASASAMLAPAEILPPSIEEKGEREKEKTDKLRERRAKKLKQRLRQKHKEQREKIATSLNPTNNKYSKDKIIQDLVKKVEKNKTKENLSSSKQVFSKLEEIQGRQNPKKHISKKKLKNYKK